MRVEIVVGNIVRQQYVDALVNSANANLRFGSGVAGAIHTAAGPELEGPSSFRVESNIHNEPW